MVWLVPGMEFLADELAALDRRGLRRRMREVVGPQGRELELDGRRVLNFSSNNYLGLANHAGLCEAARSAVSVDGLGSGASRLISGNHARHLQLEALAARLHGCEAALLFNSGYQANLGVISALVGQADRVVSDELNHASIIDGCRLSRAGIEVYRHGDVAQLDAILAEPSKGRTLVVTEAVFSMDGDRAPLAEIAQCTKERGAMLMVDEAHALGVVSAAGLAREVGVVPDVTVATLGKAAGAFGAYVAGSALLREWLLNRARSFVFTTAPSIADVAAAAYGLEIIASADGEALRDQLWARCRQFRAGLLDLGLGKGNAESAIFPVIVGEEAKAMACTERLLDRGLFVQGIRPPTVPRGTSRLRITLMAEHRAEDVSALLEALGALREEKIL